MAMAVPREEAIPPHRELTRASQIASHSKGIFKPGLVPVYCVCGLPYNPDFFMVECCRCLEWYHPQCVGETAESSRRRAWRCPKCCQP